MRRRGIQGITRRRKRALTRQDTKAAPGAGPDRARLHRRAARHQTGRRHHPPAHAGGLAVPGHRPGPRHPRGDRVRDHHRATLVVDALKMAAGRGALEAGCTMHTDRDSEYKSKEFRREIKKLGIRQSMGRTGSCYDNAAAEKCFGLLKAETDTRVWDSRQAAPADVFRFIEVEYNRTKLRRHPEHGYPTPLETRTLLQHDLAPAA
ncbi:transposase [Kitasatospora sp. NPDC059571]|uniref:transposase n=1 Tax=Kitasatospora sp. NPDC059571 TaxID=3346871 RepID=UPI0036A406E0